MPQKINDLIFKELLKRGYSLRGNTRVWNIADSKLWYLTPKQAQSYLDLENSKRYRKGVVNSDELIDNNIKEILSNLTGKPLNVIDLGCGDGKKAEYLISFLKRKVKKIRYCPIDISGYMVAKAIETISNSNVDEIIESRYNISDFENLENITPLLKEGNFNQNLYLLLGYTLGNFEITELLYAIESAMQEGDTLMIIDAIGNSKWEQRASAAKEDKLTKNFFDLIPLQLGLSKGDIRFESRFHNSRIEFYHVLLKDKKIIFQDKAINFGKGDEIITAVAYKHKYEELKKFMEMYFNKVNIISSEDKSSAMILCKK